MGADADILEVPGTRFTVHHAEQARCFLFDLHGQPSADIAAANDGDGWHAHGTVSVQSLPGGLAKVGSHYRRPSAACQAALCAAPRDCGETRSLFHYMPQATGMDYRAVTVFETGFSAACPQYLLLSVNNKGIIPQLLYGGTARCANIQHLSRVFASRVVWVVGHGSGQASLVC